ncbi:hypothetical protein CPAR01_13809 [Colletotrichum paranaense]|uniref:Secreted protein n=2 Tax=Colletotrichum acutatum species complex TaxID=2707335 RepID=A0AAI9UZN9_9PEZI|nr:uncharacterized protein CPAR01_13809 [Colletotrichum paranaense]KAK1467490.1 hypothetical protein CMEL01_11483 [Colletotrichum melonis]KAK1524861.1 hypothetical protein CPAR01_13809 [Colletotrichum paranaense]
MLHWLALDAISCNLAIWQLLPRSLSAPVACATLPTSRLPNRQADKSHIPRQVPNPILFRWWHFAPNGSQSVLLAPLVVIDCPRVAPAALPYS